MALFPITALYTVRFRHSDTGLAPTFTKFQRLSDGVALGQPAISEVGNGAYSFQWIWSSVLDPDLFFEVDGGPSIPTEEVRYVSDTLSVRDYFVNTLGGGGGGGGGGASVG